MRSRKRVGACFGGGTHWSRRVAAGMAISFCLVVFVGWGNCRGAAAQVDLCPRAGVSLPMRIDGDASLASLAGSGDGSASRPYRIEFLDITTQTASHCLEICNVDRYFVVLGCHLAGARTAAILLENARNGWIVDCTVEGSAAVAAVAGNTGNVVFCGNTFRDNEQDLVGSSTRVAWDDGQLGNYWDAYRGLDETGDGIGDDPYVLDGDAASGAGAVDRFPLVEPLADADIHEEGVLLHVAYEVGDQFTLMYSQSLTLESSMQFPFPIVSVTEGKSQMRTVTQALTVPGNGFYTLEESVIEDEGTLTTDGVPEPYESSAGQGTVRRVHRLGVVPEPGYGMVSSDMAGVSMPAQFPARRVEVGDSWSAFWSVAAEDLGLEQGDQQYRADFAFVRMEEIAGQPCAVIDARLRMTQDGFGVDPTFGARVDVVASGTIDTRAYFSLAKHRIILQTGTLLIETSTSVFGIEVLSQRLEGQVTASEEGVSTSDGETVGAASQVESGRKVLEQGLVLLGSGDAVGAAGLLERAAGVFADAGEVELEANALFALATATMQQERNRDAILPLEKAAGLFHGLPSPHDEAACYNTLGLCYRRLGEPTAALDCYHRVLELSEGDPGTQSTALLNMGVCLMGMGDYEAAIARLHEARSLKVQVSDQDGEIRALTDLGPCYRKLGQYDRALAIYQEAIALCVTPAQQAYKGMLLANEGYCYVEMGQLDMAIASFDLARETWQAIGDPCGEASSWVPTAHCQRLMGNPAAAWASLERAAALCGTSDMRGSVDYERGWCRLELGDPAAALDLFKSALEWANTGGDMEGVRNCKWGIARAYDNLGLTNEAVTWYELAVTDIETVRSRVAGEEERLTFSESVQRMYEEYLSLLLGLGRGAEALGVAERCRARTFLELLAAGPTETLNNIAEGGIRSGVVDAAVIEADLEEVVPNLPPDLAVLEYFVAEDAILVWVITQEGIQEPLRIETSPESLARQVIAFRQALEAGPSLGNTADEALLAQSRDLYTLLVQPIEDKLAGMTHVVIIPSGPLHYLSFAALLDSPGTESYALWSAQFAPGAYFGDQYALSYAPSLVALKYAQEAAGEVSTERSLLALADPDSGDPALTRLPAARVEAEAVAALFPAHDVYVDRDATEAVVQSQSSTVSQLLLSTHGLFNAVNPMYSYLVLTPTDGSDGRLHTYEVFGLDLHADLVVLSACETLLPHLKDMEAHALAVKGNTGEDKGLSPELMEELTSGDEIVGLTRAFLYAGTPSVLSSLWSVYPEATKDLMVAFYEYLDQGMDKAEALHQAQRDVRRLYPHPVFWAAFNLVGDWR